jgi:hypothetical protein
MALHEGSAIEYLPKAGGGLRGKMKLRSILSYKLLAYVGDHSSRYSLLSAMGGDTIMCGIETGWWW